MLRISKPVSSVECNTSFIFSRYPYRKHV